MSEAEPTTEREARDWIAGEIARADRFRATDCSAPAGSW
jgi:hypothetical protein